MEINLLDLCCPSLLVLFKNKSTSLTLNKLALFINAEIALDLKFNVFERIKLSEIILGSLYLDILNYYKILLL